MAEKCGLDVPPQMRRRMAEEWNTGRQSLELNSGMEK
jgi:hypothetical protein